MITIEEAKKIGIETCMRQIGYRFCLANEDIITTSIKKDGNNLYCFVGIEKYENMKTTKINDIECVYYSHCNVNLDDGDIEFLECKSA